MKPIVSVLIAYTNELHLIEDCIECINRNAQLLSIESIIVNQGDRGVLRNISDRYNNVQVIELNKPLGCGESLNFASKKASGEYLYITTPGSFVNEDIFDFYLSGYKKYSSNTQIGVMGSFLNLKKHDDTTYLHNGYLPFKTLWKDIFKKIKWLFKKAIYLDYLYFRFLKAKNTKIEDSTKKLSSGLVDGYIYGANMFIKKEVFDEFQGFDNDFYLYSEEVELQKRMFKKGYKNVIIGEVLLNRRSGSSFKNKNKNNSRTIYRDIGTLKYFEKTSGVIHKYVFKYALLIILAINIFTDIYRREFTLKMNLRHIKMVFYEKYDVLGK